jgi:lactoylglutathione lyase
MLSHVCFTVDDIEAMKEYLLARGIALKSGPAKTRAGDLTLEVLDPDGTEVEFVQSLAQGLEARAAGKFMPASRIAPAIYHLGFLVGNSAQSIAFYHDVLGFQETWRGASTPQELSWINLRVPDGTDYVEFMLYRKLPATAEAMGVRNHISLVVPDVSEAVATLAARAAAAGYTKPLEIHIGRNGKRQVNLYDPDGTRVELMEAHTVDGKPVASSTAPPPPPSHP